MKTLREDESQNIDLTPGLRLIVYAVLTLWVAAAVVRAVMIMLAIY